jgi:hypothetical protein
MSAVEHIFLEALEDLRSGRRQPMERYLERVPGSERQQLADLLASYFASQRAPADPHADPELFERTLATVDRVMADASGQAGLLPGMLVELSRTRGLRRTEIVGRLQQLLDVPDRGVSLLHDLYHRLESGTVPGPGLSKRLLEGLGAVMQMPTDELDAASRPVGPPRMLKTAEAFGRGAEGGTLRRVAEPPSEESPPEDPDLQAVYQLFFGGRTS